MTFRYPSLTHVLYGPRLKSTDGFPLLPATTRWDSKTSFPLQTVSKLFQIRPDTAILTSSREQFRAKSREIKFGTEGGKEMGKGMHHWNYCFLPKVPHCRKVRLCVLSSHTFYHQFSSCSSGNAPRNSECSSKLYRKWRMVSGPKNPPLISFLASLRVLLFLLQIPICYLCQLLENLKKDRRFALLTRKETKMLILFVS